MDSDLLLDFLLVSGSAFLAATVLPFYSEIVLLAKVAQRPELWFWLTLVASVGNTAGACVNWWMGRYLLHFQERRWFPVNRAQLERGQRWFQRYGVWSLLLSWAPVGGDALTIIAGIMRVHFMLFLGLVFVGKALRYFALVGMFDQVASWL